jgi:DNA-binding NtrC family response regulator
MALGLSSSALESKGVNRSILYFDPETHDETLVERMSACGWMLHPTSSLADAIRSIASGQTRPIGVVRCRRDDLEPVKELIHSDGKYHWIGLLSDEDRANRDVIKLVSAHLQDYFLIPADPRELEFSLRQAMRLMEIRSEESPESEDGGSHGIVGDSAPIRKILSHLGQIARSDAPVLITGASGTGKELVARAIHAQSKHCDGPFVAVNCGAIPENLIQSELFGHEKGSFTGAHKRHAGHFEQADGGTIFLDEIGELPLELQVNLLRVLEEKAIRRVGGKNAEPVDVRIIAATNVSLQQQTEQRLFREDLYYRLNVLNIEMPPLSERMGDINQLAEYFFERFVGQNRRRISGFSSQALQALNQHTWPGNVRELANRVQRAVALCDTRLIQPSDLGFDDIKETIGSAGQQLKQARSKADAENIMAVLHGVDNNVSAAARQLGVSRVTLYRLMKKYDIIAK